MLNFKNTDMCLDIKMFKMLYEFHYETKNRKVFKVAVQ